MITTHPYKLPYEEGYPAHSEHDPLNIWYDFERIPTEPAESDVTKYYDEVELIQYNKFCYYHEL